MLRFWNGKDTKAFFSLVNGTLWDVNFYWSISRGRRQWPGGMGAIVFIASVVYQACDNAIEKGVVRTIHPSSVNWKRFVFYLKETTTQDEKVELHARHLDLEKILLTVSNCIVLNNSLLSRNEHNTSHKLYMWHGIYAGKLNLVSIMLLCLATFFVLKSSSMKLVPGQRSLERQD